MSHLTLILSLLVVVMVAGVAANGHGQGQPATFECIGDGYYADRERNCVVYYRCENGQRTGLGCQDGYKFDDRLDKCLTASSVLC